MSIEKIIAELDSSIEMGKLFVISFNASTIPQAIVSMTGQVLEANPALCNALGMTIHQLRECSFMDVTHPEDRDKDMEQFNKIGSGIIEQYTIHKRWIGERGKMIEGDLTVFSANKSRSEFVLAKIDNLKNL